MALSAEARRVLEIAMADGRTATEVADAIDGALAAGALAPLGTTSALVGVDGTGSSAAPLAGTEARLDAIEAKVDAIIAALNG